MDLANIRKGQFEGLAEKMKDPLWKPDFGPDTIHPTGGATAIGARMPLICFNINLDTPNVEIARQIARRVRNIGGGLHYVKAWASPGGAEPGSGDHEPDRLHQKFHLQCL